MRRQKRSSPNTNFVGITAVFLAVIFGAALAAGLYQWEEGVRAEPTQETAPAPPPAERKASQPEPQTAPAETLKGDPSLGKGPFETACGICHPKGGKGVGSALTGSAFANKYPNDPSLFSVIRKGVGGMPGFSPQRLNDQEVAHIIAYIRSLETSASAPSPTPQPPSPAQPPTAQPTPIPTSTVSAPAQVAPATVSGKTLYESKCALCHKLPDPKAFSQWGPKYFDSMTSMANLTPEEKDALLRFLQGQ